MYLEHRGDYRELDAVMEQLLARTDSLERRGAPFVLFYDDPGRVAVDELRSRVCVPVQSRPARLDEFRYDELPRAMVVYACVEGGPEVTAQSYPILFAYLRELGWLPGGPVREVYLRADQSGNAGASLTEIQIPWAARAE